jgi:uncharacterized protein (TIGR02246 family)
MSIAADSRSTALVTKRASGHQIFVLGSEITVKISTADTGGAFTVFEGWTVPLDGPPLHRHRDQDEWWYILEGDFRFQVDGAEVYAHPGDTVFAPRGSRHTFQNIGSAPGRTLTTVVPGGLDEFFQELESAAPRGSVPDPAKLVPIFERHQLELLGPPLEAPSGESECSSQASDEQAIGDMVKQYEAAWNAGDSAGCTAAFADDASLIHIYGGQLDGRDAIEESFRYIFSTIYLGSRAVFGLREIRFLHDDVAVVFTDARVDYQERGQARVIEARPTMVVEKQRGQWRIAAFQNTRIAELPAV